MPETLPRRVGTALRAARERASLSQEALAEAAGVTAHFVSLCETGKRLPSLGVLARMASTLRTDIADLLGRAPRVEDPSHHVGVVLASLTEADREVALAMLRAFVKMRRTQRKY